MEGCECKNDFQGEDDDADIDAEGTSRKQSTSNVKEPKQTYQRHGAFMVNEAGSCDATSIAHPYVGVIESDWACQRADSHGVAHCMFTSSNSKRNLPLTAQKASDF